MAKIQVGTVPPKKKKGYWRMTPGRDKIKR